MIHRAHIQNWKSVFSELERLKLAKESLTISNLKEISISDLCCHLCFSFLKEPVEHARCKFHFCRKCLEKWMTKVFYCPACMDYLSFGNVKDLTGEIDLQFQKLLDSLRIKCGLCPSDRIL